MTMVAAKAPLFHALHTASSIIARCEPYKFLYVGLSRETSSHMTCHSKRRATRWHDQPQVEGARAQAGNAYACVMCKSGRA